jgi:hypothetical protein
MDRKSDIEMKGFMVESSAEKVRSPHGLIVFSLVTLFMLYAPRYDNIYQPVAWIIVIVSAVFCLYNVGLTNSRFYLLTLFFLSFLILLSSSFHYLALSQVDSALFITVNKDMASWGKNTVVSGASIYLLLNSSIIAGMLYLNNIDKTLKAMLIIPFLFIPSLFVGLYQGLFDLDFMSRNRLFDHPTYIMGLSYDQSSFGILLYLLFPVCVLGIISVKKAAIKIAYLLLMILLLVCLFMRGQKTTLVGIIIFTGLLPLVMLWVYGWRLKWGHVKKLIIILVVCVLMLVGLTLYYQKNPIKMPFLLDQTVAAYGYWKQGDISSLKAFSSGREIFGKIAWIITEKAPVAGWGPGGYSRNFYNTFFEIKEPPLNFHNAANYYLQVTSELGVTGGVLTLLLYILPVVTVAGARGQLSVKQRWTAGILSLSTLVFLLLYMTGPHIFSPDVLWVVALYLAGLLSVSAEFKNTKRSYRLFYPIAFIVIILITVFFSIETYKTSFGSKGYKALAQSEWWPIKNEYGYYPAENWGGAIMRWTGKKSSTSVKASGELVEFNVFAHQANSSGPKGLRLEVSINDLVKDTLHFFGSGNKKLQYYVHGIKGKDVVIKTEVSDTFNPKKLKMNSDIRDLGIARGVIGFSDNIPHDGVGFYGWEEWSGDKDFKFRWTGGRASFPSKGVDWKHLQILCAHPDIKQSPVFVTVFVDDNLVWQMDINDSDWKRVVAKSDKPVDGKVVTFQVSRTWNPRVMGVSGDGRDLGVGVRWWGERRGY